jgi:hypothetical protein
MGGADNPGTAKEQVIQTQQILDEAKFSLSK